MGVGVGVAEGGVLATAVLDRKGASLELSTVVELITEVGVTAALTKGVNEPAISAGAVEELVIAAALVVDICTTTREWR